MGGNGSSSQAQIEIDNSTTFCWTQNYISGGNVGTQAGLKIDRTQGVQIIGGAIESTGIPIMIASKNESTNGCVSGVVLGIDLENPTDHYIEFGYGLSGSAFIEAWSISNCQGWPSGAISIPYAIKVSNTAGVVFDNNKWVQNGSSVSTYWLENNNVGVVVRSHRACYGNSYPWMMINGVVDSNASPLTDWNQSVN